MKAQPLSRSSSHGRLAFRVAIALVALLLAFIPSTSHANSVEKQFDSLEHDFGKTPRGTKLTHYFTLRNDGSRELRIKKVRVSCGCTSAVASAEKIAPGEAATITAVMDTSGFQGSKTVTIYVQFERPWFTQVDLRVSADSVGSPGSSGNEVDFGVLPIGQGAVRKVQLDRPNQKNWQIVSLDYSSPHLRAEVSELSRDDKEVRYELTMTLHPTAPAGTMEDKIRLVTNDAQAPELFVVAKAKIESKLNASPESLRIGKVIPGQKITRSIVLKGAAPFKVIRVDNAAGQFEARFSTESKSTQLVVLTLTVPDDLTKIPDHLVLVTDRDDASVAIPVQE